MGVLQPKFSAATTGTAGACEEEGELTFSFLVERGSRYRRQTTTSISHKDDTSLLWQHLVNVNIKIGLFEPLELSNDDLFLN